ncbi:MAG: DUF2132 domain-containing protein [Campylobacteraceae bacterium]|nr:DUF2132 domain-containing protein [Campylobacteraceae bacterium]
MKTNPMEGMTLEKMLIALQEEFGWNELSYRVDIDCFIHDPSIKSSLKFIRKTPWARKKVDKLYKATFIDQDSDDTSDSMSAKAIK